MLDQEVVTAKRIYLNTMPQFLHFRKFFFQLLITVEERNQITFICMWTLAQELRCAFQLYGFVTYTCLSVTIPHLVESLTSAFSQKHLHLQHLTNSQPTRTALRTLSILTYFRTLLASSVFMNLHAWCKSFWCSCNIRFLLKIVWCFVWGNEITCPVDRVSSQSIVLSCMTSLQEKETRGFWMKCGSTCTKI